eukprot:952251-Rhodomonas_salina.1
MRDQKSLFDLVPKITASYAPLNQEFEAPAPFAVSFVSLSPSLFPPSCAMHTLVDSRNDAGGCGKSFVANGESSVTASLSSQAATAEKRTASQSSQATNRLRDRVVCDFDNIELKEELARSCDTLEIQVDADQRKQNADRKMAGSTPPQNYCRMQSPALTQVITTESNTPSRFSSLPRLLRKKRDGSDSSQEGKKERDKQDDSDLQKPPIHKSPSTNKARRWSLFSGGALSPAHSPLVVLLRTRAQMLATKFMRCRQQQASPTGNRPRCQCDSAAIPSQVSPSLSLPLSRSHVFSLALSLVCPHHTMSCPDQ